MRVDAQQLSAGGPRRPATGFRAWALGAEAGHEPPPPPALAPVPRVLDAIAATAARQPGACAVEIGGDRLSYADLMSRAAAVTGWLRTRGYGPGTRVAVLADKTLSVYPALLGIAGAGAVFVPLDPEAPAERNRALIERVGATAVVASARAATEVDDLVTGVLLVDEPLPFQRARAGVISRLPAAEAAWEAAAGDPAYVIFTSGSSGRPKGVEVEHRGLDNLAHAISLLVRCAPGARVTQSAKLSFDAALQQIYPAFLAGATLVPVPDGIRVDGPAMLAWLERTRVTHWDCVPSLWAPVVTALRGREGRVLPDLASLVLAGEAPRPTDIDTWRQAVPHARLFNVYGPTEATVDATAFEITHPVGTGPVPVGTPLPGVGVHVLDAAGHACEPHVEGEIFLEGVCLARGYVDDPRATAAAFALHDLGGGDLRRLYRTGDLGYRLPGGDLVCTGRRDGQIKINGVRVEPAEVESVLLGAPGVREAAVVGFSDPDSCARRLVGVVAGPVAIDVAAVRAHAVRFLGQAMVPGILLPVETMPRGGSGKIDTRAIERLAARGARDRDQGQAVASPQEQEILDVCRAILRGGIGVESDLFAAGLDSISCLRVQGELRRRGLEVSTRDIFRSPTVRSLSAVTSRREVPPAASDPVEPAGPGAEAVDVPLTAVQRGLLAAALLAPDQASTGLVQEAQYFTPALDPALVAEAAAELVGRHDALRAAVLLGGDGEPRQRILPVGGARLEPRVRRVAAPDLDVTVEQVCAEEFATAFDLASAPLLKAVLVVSDDTSVLIWTMHHLVTDGWSWELVSREFASIYASLAAGRPLPVPPRGPSLAALAALPSTMPDQAETRSLLDDLADAAAVDLGMAAASDASAAPVKQTVPLDLSGRESALVEDHARRCGVTFGALYLHCAGAALARLTGQDPVAFGLVTSGRHARRAGMEYAVAPLARVVPVAWRAGSATLAGAHERIQRANALDGTDVDAALVAAGVPIGIRAPRTTLLIQNYDSGLASPPDPRHPAADPQRSFSREAASSDVAIVVRPTTEGAERIHALRVEFWPDRVEAGTAHRLLREIHRELRRVVADRG